MRKGLEVLTRGPLRFVLFAAFAVVAACGAIVTGASGQTRDLAPLIESRTAVFAGGCFWCVESDFDKVEGVLDVQSGYTGGTLANPTYREVSNENTGHYEAVRVTYDPARVSYAQLVDYFFRHVDPTDAEGQFCDRGDSYRTAIFVGTPEERAAAEAAKAALDAGGGLPGPIVTPVLEAAEFWPAEGYHQDYAKKNPVRYGFYRRSCGRDARVAEVWAGVP
jgi:peptide-methionine (S)-S-oxide reductase